MTVVLKDRGSYIQKTEFIEERFIRFFEEIVQDSGKEFEKSDLENLLNKIISEVTSKKEVKADYLFDLIVRESNNMINQFTPNFTYLSASAFRRKKYKEASKERGFDYKNGYGDYYTLVKMLTEKGIYSEDILKEYSKKELDEAGLYINKERDRKFSYAGLFLFNKNYLAKGYNEETLELFQERYLTTVLYLLKDEDKTKRMTYVKDSYDALSNHLIGLATPTLSNSGRASGTLSSCHIITVDDSLNSIMNAVKDASTFSQNGAGLGIYLGKLRSHGSWIRGYKGRSTGVVGPSKLFNEIATYVNQLNMRPGGIALYLPLWHADIFDFLDLRMKTGSQERRAHSIFTAVNVPDEFMRRLNSRDTWTIFDPYEVNKKMGIDVNKLYDKKLLQENEIPNKKDHAFTYYYRLIEKNDNLEIKKVVKATDIYKSIFEAQKTGGTPYIYYIDTAARMNPNGHEGIPISSNLCSEIVLNCDVDEFLSKELLPDGTVVEKKVGSGLVTCNLSSISLPAVFGNDDIDLQSVIDIQFRLLDNVITLNRTVVEQATHTNNLYRSVGAGAMGLANLLADKGIRWESDKASEYVTEVFEKLNYAHILASHKLAIEKGSYPKFKGSDWDTGEYFEKRNYSSSEWVDLKKRIMSQGIRNGNLSCIAPTGSNSLINNVFASLDAPYEVIFQEEKQGMNVTVIPANYSAKTKWYYKSGFEMDELWSLKIIAAAQKGIDQSISHNVMVHESVKASEMLKIHTFAWKNSLKSLYYNYVDKNSVNRKENCESCSG
ncbi:ribonucleoside-diphosphate reductase subunit alpha [Paenibacillus xylanexedens]|uniref:ribonucleoside-diphosphate reductase subunit alpha n=1 Tax=Paenibacillus xylanexedens TaxID=528191 RepID=UPI000F54A6E2|nr:ribonucleoside-diphosphate reductase subunit alpha [Paenibacillus xylanexedens]RPK31744.1 Ribonucleotide reductase [Paenibacillus xylanexedens]